MRYTNPQRRVISENLDALRKQRDELSKQLQAGFSKRDYQRFQELEKQIKELETQESQPKPEAKRTRKPPVEAVVKMYAVAKAAGSQMDIHVPSGQSRPGFEHQSYNIKTLVDPDTGLPVDFEATAEKFLKKAAILKKQSDRGIAGKESYAFYVKGPKSYKFVPFRVGDKRGVDPEEWSTFQHWDKTAPRIW